MAMMIENRETERLAVEIAELTGESPAEAIQTALAERKRQLTLSAAKENRVDRLRRFLELEVWPTLPPDVRGRPITKQEREEILGYGPGGA